MSNRDREYPIESIQIKQLLVFTVHFILLLQLLFIILKTSLYVLE